MRKSTLRSITLLTSALLLTMGPLSGRSYSARYASSSAAAAADSTVCFTVAEADSILTTLDHLQLDLDEARALAAADSTLAAARLKAAQVPWYERLVKHPMVWFVIGAYVGVQAGNLGR